MRRSLKRTLIWCAVAMVFSAIITFIITKNIYIPDYSGGIVTDNGITKSTAFISSEVIKEQFVEIGEIATEEYYYTEVGTYDNQKSIGDMNIPFTESSCVYSYDGLIKAGIDFTQAEVEKDNLKKLITVTIPESKILSSELNEDSFKIFNEKSSIFNPIKAENINDTNKALKQKAEDEAIRKGLFGRADENAKVLVESFLMSSYDLEGYTIIVETKPADNK